MFIKYAINAYIASEAFKDWTPYGSIGYYALNSLYYTLDPTCHLIYASQYLKTCFLTRGIVERAVLIFHRHKTIVENEYQRS